MIPFNVPYVPEISKRYALEAMESNHQQGDGPFTKKVSALLSGLVGDGYVLLTPSCTHALEMASMLMNLGPGDEVIMPSFNFTSAATSVTKFGAVPVFVDIDPITKCIDVNQASDAINPRTKAISWVNYAGAAPDMEALQQLSRDFNLLLVEDNAHGLGGSYKGKPLGSFGHFATQSFHATKNVQCGEGGALIVNDAQYINRAEIIREKGTDRSRFVRGEVQKYQWVDHGSSYLLAEVLGAILLGQLEILPSLQFQRMGYWNSYYTCIPSDIDANIVKFNPVLLNATNVAHMFYLEILDPKIRNSAIKHFAFHGIPLHSHYRSLEESKAALMFELKPKKVSVHAKRVSDTLLRIPISTQMNSSTVEKICNSIMTLKGAF